MKVTDIKPFVVDCFRTNWVFIKVYTDEGIDGVGEATIVLGSLLGAAALGTGGFFLIRFLRRKKQ